METIAQEAKRLLEPIPEEDWLLSKFSNNENKCCAIGHLTRLASCDPKNYSFGNCVDSPDHPIRGLSREFLKSDFIDLTAANNGHLGTYPQPTPKQRVLALLDDMIATGY